MTHKERILRRQTALLHLEAEQLLAIAPEATHQHFKGGLYRLDGDIYDATSANPFDEMDEVAYTHLFPHAQKAWRRPRGEFGSTAVLKPEHPLVAADVVDYDGRPYKAGETVMRFKPINDFSNRLVKIRYDWRV